MFTLFKRRQRAHAALVLAEELSLAAQLTEVAFRSDAQIPVLLNEQAELTGKIEVGFVVGRCGEQDDAAIVFVDVFLNRAITFSFAVSQIMAFVNEDEAIPPKVRQLLDDTAQRQHSPAQVIFLAIRFPHFDEVLGANDERFNAVVLFKNARERGAHHRLAQADNIAD